MATRTLTLTTLCPPEPQRRDECNHCLRDRLLVTPGVRSVTFTRTAAPTATRARRRCELDYDPRLVPLQELDAELRRAGVCCQSQRASVVLGIDGMVSPRTEQMIEIGAGEAAGRGRQRELRVAVAARRVRPDAVRAAGDRAAAGRAGVARSTRAAPR